SAQAPKVRTAEVRRDKVVRAMPPSACAASQPRSRSRVSAAARSTIPSSSVSVPSRAMTSPQRSEEHTSELQSRFDLVCRLLLEKKKKKRNTHYATNKTRHIGRVAQW